MTKWVINYLADNTAGAAARPQITDSKADDWRGTNGGVNAMSIGTILIIILVIILLGGFSGFDGGPFYGTGYYGGGGLSLRLLGT
jgi:hypothetical protein